MKSKLLKIITVIMLLSVLTLTNFIYIGMELVSYAVDGVSTNNQNVEFDVNLKEENVLSITINVKKEGYFNGEITLENSNFIFDTNQTNSYINKIESNKLVLNQINAGTNAVLDLKINPIRDDIFDTNLLNISSKLNIIGIYRDSNEKDINIKATRQVTLEYKEDNTEENIDSTTKVITNKNMKVSGEDKRVLQLEMNLGLKENNYPIKEINADISLPEIEGKNPKIVTKANLNTMQDFTYNYDEKNTVELTFKNEPKVDNENKVLWKKQGSEKVVLTLIYDKDVVLDNLEIPYEEKVTLYNQKELKTVNKIIIDSEQKEELIKVTANNVESNIYKGKLYARIDRQYESKTNIAVNLANAEDSINIKEGETKYLLADKEVSANTVFNKTIINKESFDKIFGENGQITISNENGEVLNTVTRNAEVDENNNIVIDYTGKEPKALEIKTTTPVSEGDMDISHTKTIKAQDKSIVQSATQLNTNINYTYKDNIQKEVIVTTNLEETKTEANLSVDKDNLSTVIANTVEIKANLKTNNEQYNLYKNPTISFELPADVENIEINSMNLIYEDELKIKSYEVSGRTVIVYLEGEQTQYKNASIEGAVIVINANVGVNKKAATKDAEIIMTLNNEGQQVVDSKGIKVIAPKDVTTINSIKELNIETIGQEKVKEVTLEKGQKSKQIEADIEIINNNENSIENVKIVGTFPTKNSQNNINTKIIEEINIEDAEGAKVYYTEKEDASEDIQDPLNSWSETITDTSKVKKYLIDVPSIETQSSIKGTYKLEVPALLEYNQTAEEGYTTKYTNSVTKLDSSIDATTIKMGTGVGPILEAKLVPIIGTKEGTENTTVKNGEVIKYKIEVSNTGSEDIENVIVAGEVPEGTTLVVPQDNYEYTGASYYKELEDRVFTTKVDRITVGQTYNVEYEVRVNNNLESETKLSNTAQIRYGDVLKQSNATELTTEEGKIRVSVKRVTDRKVDLYETGTVKYFAIVENISDEKQENVKVRTNLPSTMSVEDLTLLTGLEEKEIEDNEIHDIGSSTTQETRFIEEDELIGSDENNLISEEIDYKDTIDIGDLEKGANKVLCYVLSINKTENTGKSQFSVIAINNDNKEYRSNIISDDIYKVNVSLTMNSNTQGQYIKSGDILEYTIIAKNNENNKIEGLKIQDSIPDQLTINKVSVNGQEVEQSEDENYVEVNCSIEANEEATIKIEAVTDYSDARTTAEPITNVAYAEILGERVANTSEITHIILAEEQEDEDNESREINHSSSDIANGNKIITGIAWLDENGNGQKDDGEQTLNNVKAKLLNTETSNLVKDKNGNILEATTNDNGLYVLDNIYNGKYIVVFDYNKTLYTVTKYKAENIDDSKNSKAITSQLQIENEQQTVAATDIYEISDNNISNVNIGLIELKDFSFRLDKYISKITVQNSSGTTVKEYTNATVAKAELDSKKVNGTTVIIEYEIKVTNIGELDGYVRKIVDYMPNDLKFSSEINKDWYQVGNDLYNGSLANEKISAGESKSVRLILTKAMTENNTGLTNNSAEIAESYNELGIVDSKSTAGNKAKGEEDYGSADTIVSLKTGAEVYVSIIAVVLVVTGVIAFVIIRKKQNIEDIK